MTETKVSTAVKVAIITLAIGGIAAAAASIKIGQPKCPVLSNKQVTVRATNPLGVEKIEITSANKAQAEGQAMDKICSDLLLGGKTCEFPVGDVINVSVTTKEKFKVTKFGGNCDTVQNPSGRIFTCTVDKFSGNNLLNVTAELDKTEADIVIKEKGLGRGTTVESTKPWNCSFAGISGNCTTSYAKGKSIDIQAGTDSNFLLASWEGCDSLLGDHKQICKINVTGDKNLTVDFVKHAICGPLKPDFVSYDSENKLINDCFNFKTDATHCGNYITNCAKDGKICTNGSCVCPLGQTNCNGTCVNTANNYANCGKCGNSCVGDQTCNLGICHCPIIFGDKAAICNNKCVNTATDSGNCGSCGTTCSNGKTCIAGKCQCSLGQKDCNGTCVGLTDTCCSNGMTNCNNTCVNTKTNNDNCNTCGNKCGTGKKCQDGKCIIVCPIGQTNCDGTCINLSNSYANCGKCGNSCVGDQTCNLGICHCPVIFGDKAAICNNKCVNTATDSGNCGSCGTTCNGGSTCVSGKCTCPVGKKACGSGSSLRCIGLFQAC